MPCCAGSARGSPSNRIFPCDRNSTRSQTSSTSYMLWDVHKIPQFSSRASSRICRRTVWAAAGSREAVGSSSNSSSGRFRSALASATRVCSPEDSTPQRVLRSDWRSNFSSSVSIRPVRFAIP